MESQGEVVAANQVLRLIIEINSSVNTVVGPDTPRSSVGTSMDALKTYLHTLLNKVGLIVEEKVVVLVTVELMLTQQLLISQI